MQPNLSATFWRLFTCSGIAEQSNNRAQPHFLRDDGLDDAPRPRHRTLVIYSSLPDIGAGFRPVEAENSYEELDKLVPATI